MRRDVREYLGVLLQDVPRYGLALARSGNAYLSICNRDDRLEPATDGSGYRCDRLWTSDLHAPKVMPSLGTWIMRRALRDHPIRMSATPPLESGPPQVSFVIGHRGDHRLPHLLKALESIAGQCDTGIECIVVEQDVHPLLQGRLPDWVRLVHTPPPVADMPYCRSWAFNVGARLALGDLLVLHDNDVLIPADYAVRSLDRMRAGFDVINLKRFGFYLGEAHTREIFAGRAEIADIPPAGIMQNALGGGTIAIRRDAYVRIGGMDEGFVGWGGEDNEFWERAQTLRVWPYGCLPYLHLWHPAQAGKCQPENPTLARYRQLSRIDAVKRIAALRSIRSGELSEPTGWSAVAALEQRRTMSLAPSGQSVCGVEK